MEELEGALLDTRRRLILLKGAHTGLGKVPFAPIRADPVENEDPSVRRNSRLQRRRQLSYETGRSATEAVEPAAALIRTKPIRRSNFSATTGPLS